jgi:hypothetical protein
MTIEAARVQEGKRYMHGQVHAFLDLTRIIYWSYSLCLITHPAIYSTSYLTIHTYMLFMFTRSDQFQSREASEHKMMRSGLNANIIFGGRKIIYSQNLPTTTRPTELWGSFSNIASLHSGRIWDPPTRTRCLAPVFTNSTADTRYQKLAIRQKNHQVLYFLITTCKIYLAKYFRHVLLFAYSFFAP